ncbi:MAG: FG-GAP-like repeat-containing protein [archaeon]
MKMLCFGAVIALVVISILITSCEKADDKELVIAMSQFTVSYDSSGKQVTKAGAAKVWVAHPDEDWRVDQILNPDSNVAHKGLVADMDADGKNEMYIVGGQEATLKRYDLENGQWVSRMLWKPDFVRVRDIEFGDVDGDGKDELVAGTHDKGVVVVVDYDSGNYGITEVYRRNSTFIHEVEIGDLDGDGVDEFFADPTDPNVDIGMKQLGSILMFKWNGTGYDHFVVDAFNYTHSKEMVLGDIDNDGKTELVAVLYGVPKSSGEDSQAVLTGDVKAEVLVPLKIMMYEYPGKGQVLASEMIGRIDGEWEARSLAIGDINEDGNNELVVGTGTGGLQIIYRNSTGWQRYVLDKDLKGKVHAVFIADLDGDGRNEILANSDKMSEVRLYKWSGKDWTIRTVLNTPAGDWIWAMDYGDVDNI